MWIPYESYKLKGLPSNLDSRRFSRASILLRTVMPCNLNVMILSLGPNHLGSYLISRSKFRYQRITRKRTPAQHTYTINEMPLESCDAEKDLDLWVSSNLFVLFFCVCVWVLSNLTSDIQVTEQCTKVNNLFGFVRRASRCTQKRRTLYRSIVRCHLGYLTQVYMVATVHWLTNAS